MIVNFIVVFNQVDCKGTEVEYRDKYIMNKFVIFYGSLNLQIISEEGSIIYDLINFNDIFRTS